MNRRTLLSGASALVAAATLAACATGAPVTPASVAQDVNLIATSFAATLPQLTATGLSGATATAVSKAVADLQAVAGAIGAADTTAAAQPLVARVEADVNAVIAVLAGLPLPPPISTVLQAAAVLLPVIELAVGMTLPAGAAPSAMTVDLARAALRRLGQPETVSVPLTK